MYMDVHQLCPTPFHVFFHIMPKILQRSDVFAMCPGNSIPMPEFLEAILETLENNEYEQRKQLPGESVHSILLWGPSPKIAGQVSRMYAQIIRGKPNHPNFENSAPCTTSMGPEQDEPPRGSQGPGNRDVHGGIQPVPGENW